MKKASTSQPFVLVHVCYWIYETKNKKLNPDKLVKNISSVDKGQYPAYDDNCFTNQGLAEKAVNNILEKDGHKRAFIFEINLDIKEFIRLFAFKKISRKYFGKCYYYYFDHKSKMVMIREQSDTNTKATLSEDYIDLNGAEIVFSGGTLSAILADKAPEKKEPLNGIENEVDVKKKELSDAIEEFHIFNDACRKRTKTNQKLVKKGFFIFTEVKVKNSLGNVDSITFEEQLQNMKSNIIARINFLYDKAILLLRNRAYEKAANELKTLLHHSIEVQGEHAIDTLKIKLHYGQALSASTWKIVEGFNYIKSATECLDKELKNNQNVNIKKLSAIGHYQLCQIYHGNNNIAAAWEHLNMSEKLRKQYSATGEEMDRIYFYQGLLLIEKNDNKKALQKLKLSYEFRRSKNELNQNLIPVLENLNEISKAEDKKITYLNHLLRIYKHIGLFRKGIEIKLKILYIMQFHCYQEEYMAELDEVEQQLNDIPVNKESPDVASSYFQLAFTRQHTLLPSEWSFVKRHEYCVNTLKLVTRAQLHLNAVTEKNNYIDETKKRLGSLKQEIIKKMIFFDDMMGKTFSIDETLHPEDKAYADSILGGTKLKKLKQSTNSTSNASLSSISTYSIHSLSKLLPLPLEKEEQYYGMIKMVSHPNYNKVINVVRKLGYAIEFCHFLNVWEKVPGVRVFRSSSGYIEKALILNENMRWMDLEHEIGHIKQRARFQNENEYPTETKGKQSGVLNKKMNKLLELHNRLIECMRLIFHRAPYAIIKEHVMGLREYLNWYKDIKKEYIKNPKHAPFGRHNRPLNKIHNTYFLDLETQKKRYLRIIDLYKEKFGLKLCGNNDNISIPDSYDNLEYEYKPKKEKELKIDILFLELDINNEMRREFVNERLKLLQSWAEKNDWKDCIGKIKTLKKQQNDYIKRDDFQQFSGQALSQLAHGLFTTPSQKSSIDDNDETRLVRGIQNSPDSNLDEGKGKGKIEPYSPS